MFANGASKSQSAAMLSVRARCDLVKIKINDLGNDGRHYKARMEARPTLLKKCDTIPKLTQILFRMACDFFPKAISVNGQLAGGYGLDAVASSQGCPSAPSQSIDYCATQSAAWRRRAVTFSNIGERCRQARRPPPRGGASRPALGSIMYSRMWVWYMVQSGS